MFYIYEIKGASYIPLCDGHRTMDEAKKHLPKGEIVEEQSEGRGKYMRVSKDTDGQERLYSIEEIL